MSINKAAYIYNLFPTLAGKITNWVSHFPRIANMGFNWVFINPIQYPGTSGSIYSIKDYYRLNPALYDSSVKQSEIEQVKWMLKYAHDNGLKVILDLVINHTAIDHPFTKTFRNWYKLKNGKIANPGALDNGKWVSWDDLAEIDNENSLDKDNLWKYWLDLAIYYLNLGFDGFRCDAAYKLTSTFWKYLIGKTKDRFSESIWFAESLGCPIESTIILGKSGFDYTFNSLKWWDYEQKWCLSQHEKNIPYSKTISFPESHDTERVAHEYNLNPIAIKHKYLFSALFSSGIMMPMGFEYAMTKRLNVVQTTEYNLNDIKDDYSEYITKVNVLKGSYQILNEESYINKLVVKDKDIAILLKTSLNKKERILLIINKDFNNSKLIDIESYLLTMSWDSNIKDISISNRLGTINPKEKIVLLPGDIKIFYSTIN